MYIVELRYYFQVEKFLNEIRDGMVWYGMVLGAYEIGRDLTVDCFNEFFVPKMRKQKVIVKGFGYLLDRKYVSVLSLVASKLNDVNEMDQLLNKGLYRASSDALALFSVRMKYEDSECFTPFAELVDVGSQWFGLYRRLRGFSSLEEGIDWFNQSDEEISRQIKRNYISLKSLVE